MKRYAAILSALLLLLLCACAERQTPEQAWRYALTTQTQTTEFKADDGTVVAARSYEQPILTLENEAGETFSGSEPALGATAEQLAVCRAFNEGTAPAGLSDAELEETGRELYEMFGTSDVEFPLACEETTVSETYRNGDLLSVLAVEYVNLGGPHPTNGLRGWTFDLAKGAFVSLWELTDRPDELKQALVAEIAARIDASELVDGYYEDWRERLAQTETFACFFGAEGVTVWFQEYELAPHAVGVPLFTIPYDTVSPYLNADGERLLGAPD